MGRARTDKSNGSTSLLRTYYWLTKPGIIYGNAINTAAGFFLASAVQRQVDVWLLAAVLAGSSLVIACGCVINNVIDRGIDQKMARTSKRALAQGTIPERTAVIYGSALGVMGFTVLALCTNLLTVAIGAVGLFFYLVLYSIGKRRSVYGTLIGSVSGAVPPLAGYCAVTNRIDAGAVILFSILVCWQVPHFYAIALYRLKDYTAAGLPVWPAKKGLRSTQIQMLLFVVAFTVAAALLTVYGYTGTIYLVVMAVLGIAWLWRALQGFRPGVDTARWARGMFFFSLVITLATAVMLSVGSLLP